MDNDRKDTWFRAKKYGVGWSPATWQGWVVSMGYLILMLGGGLCIKNRPVLIIPFVIYATLLSGALIFICWKKGEKPKWHWGDKKD